MREKIIIVLAFLILLGAFYSSSTSYTGQYHILSKAGDMVRTRCDVNGDGDINREDIHDMMVALTTGKDPSERPDIRRLDLSGNGVIGQEDLDLTTECVEERYGKRLTDYGRYGNDCKPGESVCAIGGRKESSYKTCEYHTLSGKWRWGELKYCLDGMECVPKQVRTLNRQAINVHECAYTFKG